MSKEEKESAGALGKSEMEKRLATLRRLPFSELINLPEYETENLKSGKYDVRLTTYRDKLKDGRLQIIVQWYFHIRLGFGHIGADGFTISHDNVIQDMDEKALYEFI